MFCYRCGAEFPDDSRYCRMCGTPVVSPPADRPPARPAETVRAEGAVATDSPNPAPQSPTDSGVAAAESPPPSPDALAGELPAASIRHRGEWRKRKRRRPWYKKLPSAVAASRSGALKVIGVIIAVAVIIWLVGMAR